MYFLILLLLTGCLKPKINSPEAPVFREPTAVAPPIGEPPRPGFVTTDRLEDIMLLDLQSIQTREERERTRYFVACDRVNQNLPVNEYEQGMNLAMNRLSAERFTSKVTPIGQAGCIFRIDKDDYSISQSDWQIIENNTLLDVVPDTVRNANLQFLTQTRKPWIFGVETLMMYEGDAVANQGGNVYYAITNQATLTEDFLAQEGINLQSEVDDQNVLFSGFSQSQIALGKTRLIQVVESDNGFCLGTFDQILGGDDLFDNPFSKELARAGGRLNSNKVLKHDAQEWICSLNNGMFGKWRLNNAADIAEVVAPTNVVSRTSAVDPSIRIGDCNFCHYLQVAIPFADQIAAHLRGNSAFNASEKTLGDVFFRYDKISAVIGDINARNSRALQDLGVVAGQDPLTQGIWKPFRAEMNATQVAAFTFLTTEEFIERLKGTDKSSQKLGNLINGGTVSLATLSSNFKTLVAELRVFRDNEL